MGEAVEASSTTVEMEAAEQLIQLSGGGCDDGESECRSADSIRAGDGDGEKRTAVESKGAEGVSVMAGEKRGGGEEAAPVSAVESGTGKRQEKIGAAKGGRGEDEEAVIGGVARRRPRFRSLAAIYRETRRMDKDDHGHCREEAEEGETGDGEGKLKKKRATDGAADGEAVPSAAPCKAKRAVRRRTS